MHEIEALVVRPRCSEMVTHVWLIRKGVSVGFGRGKSVAAKRLEMSDMVFCLLAVGGQEMKASQTSTRIR
jgi:hypothetical protein